MANQIPVTTLLTLTRQRANMEASQFIGDQEFVELLDRAYKELYDMLVETYDDYFLTSTTFTLTPPSDTYPLPADFYKLLGVDLQVDPNQQFTLFPFMFNERNNWRNTPYAAINAAQYLRYRLEGANIKFIPQPSTGQVITLWYVPVPLKLTTAASPAAGQTNTIDAINGYDEYCILDAAINALIKEESDPTALQQLKAETTARIKSSAANRDIGMPERMTDITQANSQFLWPFRTFY